MLKPVRCDTSKIKFLYEQEGITETVIKSDFVKLFHKFPAIKRAYLVRVDYGTGDEYNVVLALVFYAEDPEPLLSLIGEIVERHLASGVFMDIMFLSSKLESDVKSVARPFYDYSELQREYPGNPP